MKYFHSSSALRNKSIFMICQFWVIDAIICKFTECILKLAFLLERENVRLRKRLVAINYTESACKSKRSSGVQHSVLSCNFSGIPISQQHLIHDNIEMRDEYTLRDYNIQNGSTLRLVLGMRGGPINTRRG